MLPNENTPASEKFSLDDIKAVAYSIKARDYNSASWEDLNSSQYVAEMTGKLGLMVSSAVDYLDHRSTVYDIVRENLLGRCSDHHKDRDCVCLDDLKETFFPTVKKYVESNVTATYTNLASDEHGYDLVDFFNKEMNFDRFNCEKESGVGSETKEESASDYENGNEDPPTFPGPHVPYAQPAQTKQKQLRCIRIPKMQYLCELDHHFVLKLNADGGVSVYGVFEDQENPLDSLRPLTEAEQKLALSLNLNFSDELLHPFVKVKAVSKQ